MLLIFISRSGYKSVWFSLGFNCLVMMVVKMVMKVIVIGKWFQNRWWVLGVT